MPVLPDTNRADVHAGTMDAWSVRGGVETPVTKSELRSLINLLDSQLDAAEGTALAAIPAGVGKTWLTANQGLARELMASIEKKRSEVL